MVSLGRTANSWTLRASAQPACADARGAVKCKGSREGGRGHGAPQPVLRGDLAAPPGGGARGLHAIASTCCGSDAEGLKSCLRNRDVEGLKHRVREFVFFTLVLLCLLLYVFANALTQLSKETDLESKYFATVTDSMYTLMVYGARPGEWGACLDDFAREDPCLGIAFVAFMLLAALLLVNMLARILSELAGALAPVGREVHRQAKVRQATVKGSGLQPQLRMDRGAGSTISEEELCGILSDRAATRALTELGVDARGLAGLADASFAPHAPDRDTEQRARLGLCALVEAAIQSRGSDRVTTRDVALLQSSLEKLLHEQQQEVQVILEGLTALCAHSLGPKVPTDADGTAHGSAPTVLC